MRGRYAAELTHALRRALQIALTRRVKHVHSLRWSLETFDLRQRLGRVRARLVAADGRLTAATVRCHHRADGRLRAAAARLDSLSPLAVLARGYAVCWNADRSAIIRDVAGTAVGDQVTVTLQRGALECEVTARVPEGR
jgi:exodeoxyribonuclease VII large subunit